MNVKLQKSKQTFVKIQDQPEKRQSFTYLEIILEKDSSLEKDVHIPVGR